LCCRWCGATPEFLNYHDTEWGFPVSDDLRLFEKLCLEGFLGLSTSHDIIVKQHAGLIEVDTQSGEFTEIKVILPRQAGRSSRRAADQVRAGH
jgi:3-methyladenine DNA glycosylase Tag